MSMFESKPIIDKFLNKTVLVEVQGCAVVGRLVHYQLPCKNPHKPLVLVLKNLQDNLIIVRGFEKISELKQQ